MSHDRRPSLSRHHPVHVTLRVLPDVRGLRSVRSFVWIERAFRAAARRADHARFVHYSVQGNHIHLIVEAEDRRWLRRHVQGFEVRVARWLNEINGRRGRVFADRYHAHVLRTPREAHRALGYVLRNDVRHFGRRTAFVDPFSSAASFSGWSSPVRVGWSPTTPGEPLVIAPASWMLRAGWRKHGQIDPFGAEQNSTLAACDAVAR